MIRSSIRRSLAAYGLRTNLATALRQLPVGPAVLAEVERVQVLADAGAELLLALGALHLCRCLGLAMLCLFFLFQPPVLQLTLKNLP